MINSHNACRYYLLGHPCQNSDDSLGNLIFHLSPNPCVRRFLNYYFPTYFDFWICYIYLAQELGRRLIAVYSRDKPFSNCAVNDFSIYRHINICFSSEMQVSRRSWSIIFLPTSIFPIETLALTTPIHFSRIYCFFILHQIFYFNMSEWIQSVLRSHLISGSVLEKIQRVFFGNERFLRPQFFYKSIFFCIDWLHSDVFVQRCIFKVRYTSRDRCHTILEFPGIFREIFVRYLKV